MLNGCRRKLNKKNINKTVFRPIKCVVYHVCELTFYGLSNCHVFSRWSFFKVDFLPVHFTLRLKRRFRAHNKIMLHLSECPLCFRPMETSIREGLWVSQCITDPLAVLIQSNTCRSLFCGLTNSFIDIFSYAQISARQMYIHHCYHKRVLFMQV